MIKSSIELAQILSIICTEQYTATYYKIVEKVYNCLKANNTLFIYVSPDRYGIALDFQNKLSNSHKDVKIGPSIEVCQIPLKFELDSHPEDTLLLLDNNEEILDIAKKNNVNTLSLTEHFLETTINYTIPSANPQRVSEVQKMLLNSLSEEIIKFLI